MLLADDTSHLSEAPPFSAPPADDRVTTPDPLGSSAKVVLRKSRNPDTPSSRDADHAPTLREWPKIPASSDGDLRDAR